MHENKQHCQKNQVVDIFGNVVFVLAPLVPILPYKALESQPFARHDDDDDKDDDDETFSNLNLWKNKMKIVSQM